MPSLTVLVNHVASLRQHMQTGSPDPVAAAIIAQLAGADGIAVYMREDHQPIRERDLRMLRNCVQGRFIVHMAPTSEMVGYALDIKPQRVILVPAMEEADLRENGLDLIVHSKSVFETVDTLQSNGIAVGICISAEPEQAKLAHQIRADWVQVHAGKLRAANSSPTQSRALDNIVDTVKIAHKLRLRVAVGHGLNYDLIKLFKGIPEIDEFSVGQSLIARALLKGLDPAIKEIIETTRSL